MNNHGITIGELVQQERERLGWSKRTLARMLAKVSGAPITRHEVYRWECKSVIPGPEWRRWLAQVLHLPLERLDAAAAYSEIQRLTTRLQRAPEAK